jgi:adenine-specific DNA-methyltransferase
MNTGFAVAGLFPRDLEMPVSQLKAAVKRHGKHYTPPALADFLAGRVLGQFLDSDGRSLRILDPACGDGELLFAVHRVAERLLPNHAIALVGYDLDGVAIDLARERAAELGIATDWHQGDFLQTGRTLSSGSFDAIITNPPYVRTQQLGHETAQLLASEFRLTGRIDLTHPFVVMMSSLLRPGGIVGLLCSNRFLTTKAGANMRRVFQTSLDPLEVYDLGDTKLFSAAVLPAIVIAVNRSPQESRTCSFSSAYVSEDPSIANGDSLFEALTANHDAVISHEDRAISVRVGTLVRSLSTAEPWRAVYASSDDWLEKIQAATWRTFGDIAKIRVGIKTTADRVFISDCWDLASPAPESDLLLPLITHDNVTPWQVSEHLQTKVLYPYDLSKDKRTLVEMKRYPSAMAYLESHGEQLKGRRYVVEGGRQWFEIWVPHKPSMWKIPKIVFPDISADARFAIDRSGAVVNGDCYWISLADIGSEDIALLMLAVANSALGKRFYDEVCGNKLYSGRRRWMTQYVSRLPLPDPQTDAASQLIQATRKLVDSGIVPDQRDAEQIDKLVDAAFTEPVHVGDQSPTTLF